MNDDVIDVLIYLFENYIETDFETESAQEFTASGEADNRAGDEAIDDIAGAHVEGQDGESALFTAEDIDSDVLRDELVQSGFDSRAVRLALRWLDGFRALTDGKMASLPGGSSMAFRYFTGKEVERIDVESQGLLLSLERSGVIDSSIREFIIDRIMALDSDDVDVDHVRWITMMILCNHGERLHDLPWVEQMVMNGVSEARIH